MSEFSESWQVLGLSTTLVEQRLSEAKLDHKVYGGKTWTAFVAPKKSVRDVPRVFPELLLHYIFAGDHGCWVELFQGGKRLTRIAATFEDRSEKTFAPEAWRTAGLLDDLKSRAIRQYVEVAHDFRRQSTHSKYVVAESLGLDQFQWKSYEYALADNEIVFASGPGAAARPVKAAAEFSSEARAASRYLLKLREAGGTISLLMLPPDEATALFRQERAEDLHERFAPLREKGFGFRDGLALNLGPFWRPIDQALDGVRRRYPPALMSDPLFGEPGRDGRIAWPKPDDAAAEIYTFRPADAASGTYRELKNLSAMAPDHAEEFQKPTVDHVRIGDKLRREIPAQMLPQLRQFYATAKKSGYAVIFQWQS